MVNVVTRLIAVSVLCASTGTKGQLTTLYTRLSWAPPSTASAVGCVELTDGWELSEGSTGVGVVWRPRVWLLLEPTVEGSLADLDSSLSSYSNASAFLLQPNVVCPTSGVRANGSGDVQAVQSRSPFGVNFVSSRVDVTTAEKVPQGSVCFASVTYAVHPMFLPQDLD